MGFSDKPNDKECIIVGRNKTPPLPGMPKASDHLPGKWHNCKACKAEIYVIDEMEVQAKKSYPGSIPSYYCLICSALQAKKWGLKDDEINLKTLQELKRKQN